MVSSSLQFGPVPWQLTGNHWLALPCIDPTSGSVYAVSLLDRRTRSALEFAGGAEFEEGQCPPLLRPVVWVDGQEADLPTGVMAWKRTLDWIPTFERQFDSVTVGGTVFAPYGREADVAGAIYVLSVQNRTREAHDVRLSFMGMLGHRQLRVRTPRPFNDAHRADVDVDVVLLSGSTEPVPAVLALCGDGPCFPMEGPSGKAAYALMREFRLEPGERIETAVYLAAAPERDGATASVRAMRRRGWKSYLRETTQTLQTLQQNVAAKSMTPVVIRNLMLAYFYAVGRALDDGQYYLMRTRAPTHFEGITVREWDALTWTVQAIQLADPPLARELILRMCELHGHAPGWGVNYMDGSHFEPGFTLEGAAAYPLAADRYLVETTDPQFVEEPVLGETLYAAHEVIAERRDETWPLYSAEFGASGDRLKHPFALHGNAVVARALEILRRTLDEETAKQVEDPVAVRAAIMRRLVVSKDGGQVFASSVDKSGNAETEDDSGSIFWLPYHEAIERADSSYRRSVKGLGRESERLVYRCAQLIGPQSSEALRWLREAPLDQGLAAEWVDVEGYAMANTGDAALAGLVAWSVWYAVNVLGESP